MRDNSRKVWWLIVISCLYLAVAVGTWAAYGRETLDNWLMLYQFVWVVVLSLPLFIKPLGCALHMGK